MAITNKVRLSVRQTMHLYEKAKTPNHLNTTNNQKRNNSSEAARMNKKGYKQ